jgi:hypothetical protein
MAIGNIYVITAIAVVGGGLFGFGMFALSPYHMHLSYKK